MKTPKEKAQELVSSFMSIKNIKLSDYSVIYLPAAKQCALIAVEEMLGEYQSMSDLESKIVINDEVKFVVHQLIYWMEVKQEIEKL